MIGIKLTSPSFPELFGGAAYFYIQTCHAESAVQLVIDIVKNTKGKELEACADKLEIDFTQIAASWAIEALLQGAWLKLFHMWEADTKTYFDGQYTRAGISQPNWRNKSQSHCGLVKDHLSQFDFIGADETLSIIDKARVQVNKMKHEGDVFVTHEEYKQLMRAIKSFWEVLASQEEFAIGTAQF